MVESNDVKACIEQLQLPSHFLTVVERWYQPIAQDFAEICAASADTIIFGIQGTQGSGKSTMAQFLALLLEQQNAFNVASLSIDDFYLTAAQRQLLAEDIHPLLKTRGVPGTHDVVLAITTLNKLKNLKAGEVCKIPRFNKAIDDRENEAQWDEIIGPIDAIIFEGWCVGAQHMDEASLLEPINELEAIDDADGAWRNYINAQLKNHYPSLFNLIDHQLVISTPSFDNVYAWRLLQEQKLAKTWAKKHPDQASKIINEVALKRFISHYERLTKHCLLTLPEKASWCVYIDQNHVIQSCLRKTKVYV